MVINMIKKNIFISRYLDILRKQLEEYLPIEDALTDMCEKANEIIYKHVKRD
uniref:Uncharacterized protein n=1 Tax=viral metagenome TaxID=1070528 RepID=A0A6M3JNU3_9ZZZZ